MKIIEVTGEVEQMAARQLKKVYKTRPNTPFNTNNTQGVSTQNTPALPAPIQKYAGNGFVPPKIPVDKETGAPLISTAEQESERFKSLIRQLSQRQANSPRAYSNDEIIKATHILSTIQGDLDNGRV